MACPRLGSILNIDDFQVEQAGQPYKMGAVQGS
jgi:hypothetical protein